MKIGEGIHGLISCYLLAERQMPYADPRSKLPLTGSDSLDLPEDVALLTLLLRIVGHVALGLQLPVLGVDVQADGVLAHHWGRSVGELLLGGVVHDQLHDLPVRAGLQVVLLPGLQL